MTQYIPLVISAVALLYSLYSGSKKETKEDTTAMTMIQVKLEAINDGIKEIKQDMKNVKTDLQEIRERLVIVEQSAKSAHRRLDSFEGKEAREEKK